jgi:signal-transduction protein with cAMP-binding, CBS, and nucleotidyltransferase domain
MALPSGTDSINIPTITTGTVTDVQATENSAATTRDMVTASTTADVTTVSAEDSVDQCMHHMTTKSIRHLPVCKDGKVIGMVSVGEVVKELIRHQPELIGYV